MKLFIDNEELTGPFEETRLGPLIERLQKERLPEGRFLVQLRVDGRDHPGLSAALREQPLSEVGRIDLRFAPLETLIARNLENAKGYLERLLPGIDQAAQLFRTGKEQEANQVFLQIIDGIDWFAEVIDSVVEARKQDPATLRLGDQTYRDRKTRLLELTSQMMEANQNRDWVLLADLLEYELQPFYTDWKTHLPDWTGPGPDSGLTH